MKFETPKFNPIPDKTKENIEKNRMFKTIEKSLVLTPSKKLDLATFLLYDKKKIAYLGDHKIIEPEDDENTWRKKFNEEIEELKKVLKGSGLFYEMAKNLKKENEILGFNMVVARNKEDLEKFLEVEKEDNDREMGLLLGYPETAIEGYENRDFLIVEDLPKNEQEKIEKEGVLKFSGFSPSKKYWREELKEVRKIQSLIKEKSSSIYKQIIESDL